MGGITTTLFQRPRDPQFNNTTLLLSGNFPTNGAQNNTFLDSSSNGFTITRNPSTGPNATTQGSFSPFSQTGWGNYFDGSSYLTAAANSGFSLAGDFTIEMWINPASLSTGNSIIIIESAAASGLYLAINAGTSTVNIFLNSSTASFIATPVSGISLNVWSHIALVRSGSTVTLYVNGVAASGTGSSAATLGSSTTPFRIGGFTGAYTGYISNLRVVNGRAVYTSNFTPSPSPLTATSGGQNPPTGTQTTLLTCQANRFVDAGGLVTPITISVAGGTPSVQPFSPFAPSGAYTTTAVGGSGYFDGTTDYLTYTTPSTVVREWWVNDFTVEAWIYPTTLTGWDYLDGANRISTVIGNASPTATNNFWSFGPINTGAVRLYYFNGAGVLVTSTETVRVNQWNHIAFTKTSTGIRIFVNGVGTTATAISGTPQSGNTFPLTVGQINNTACNGYISGVRILNGTAQYSGTTYTIPTAPPTAITNTSFLLNFTNAGIVDSTAKNVVETVGNAQISTTQSRFGGTSMFFDGAGDYLNIPTTNQSLTLGSANWTIEFWIYLPSLPNTRKEILYLNGNTSGWAAMSVHICSNNKLGLSFSESGSAWKTDDTTGIGNALTATTWQHVAVTRNGQNIQVYLNGVSQGATYTTTAATTSLMTSYTLNQIATYNTSSFQLNAYIDDLRITVGVVRYTANFNVPTIGFTDR